MACPAAVYRNPYKSLFGRFLSLFLLILFQPLVVLHIFLLVLGLWLVLPSYGIILYVFVFMFILLCDLQNYAVL